MKRFWKATITKRRSPMYPSFIVIICLVCLPLGITLCSIIFGPALLVVTTWLDIWRCWDCLPGPPDSIPPYESMIEFETSDAGYTASPEAATAEATSAYTALASSIVTEYMIKQAKDLFGPTATVAEMPGGTCTLSPAMMYGKHNDGKIRTWFHMTGPDDCGDKCRDTPNCAFFFYDGSSTECTLKDLNPAHRLIPANPAITSGACVSLSVSGSAAPPSEETPGVTAPLADVCPRDCWKSAKTWMKILSVGLTVLGVFVVAVIFLNAGELRSWLMPYSLHGSASAVAMYTVVAFALHGFLISGSWISIVCSGKCGSTALFSAVRDSLLAWLAVGVVCCVLMLSLMLRYPHQDPDADPSEATPMCSYEPSIAQAQRSVQAACYYPPQWANTVNANGEVVKVYHPPRWSHEAPARQPRR